jgi:hypothetical protein
MPTTKGERFTVEIKFLGTSDLFSVRVEPVETLFDFAEESFDRPSFLRPFCRAKSAPYLGSGQTD